MALMWVIRVWGWARCSLAELLGEVYLQNKALHNLICMCWGWSICLSWWWLLAKSWSPTGSLGLQLFTHLCIYHVSKQGRWLNEHWDIPLQGLHGHPLGKMIELAAGEATVQLWQPNMPAGALGKLKQTHAARTAPYLGMQFGEDPSISHVANRFMGTGLLRAPLPGKLNRPLLSAMVGAAGGTVRRRAGAL